MKFHPDRQPVERRDEAEKLMTRLNSARDTLLDPDRRKAYDLKRSQSNPER
jgi:curved DNA-binding protein CbpA